MSAHNRKYHRKAPFENAEKQKRTFHSKSDAFFCSYYLFHGSGKYKNHVQEPCTPFILASL